MRGGNAQPQSDREIANVVGELRRMDPLLNLRWNPEAVMLEKGRYTEVGALIRPRYEGRWEVIRDLPRGQESHDGKPFVVIVTLTEPHREGGVLYTTKDGPYAPVGDWVIELMRSADAANVRVFEEIRKRLWAQHDTIERREEEIDEAMAREGLNRVQHKANFAGGQGNWSPVKIDLKDEPQPLTTP